MSTRENLSECQLNNVMLVFGTGVTNNYRSSMLQFKKAAWRNIHKLSGILFVTHFIKQIKFLALFKICISLSSPFFNVSFNGSISWELNLIVWLIQENEINRLSQSDLMLINAKLKVL